MYTDTKPCAVCGAPVRLEARRTTAERERDAGPGPVGPAAGFVGAGDDPVDDRVCTNDACPTHGPESADRPTP